MKRFMITVLVVLVVGVVATGLYRGWFSLSSRSPDAGSNQVNINLTLDPDKVKADAETVRGQTAEFMGQAKEAAIKPAGPAKVAK